MLVLRFALAGGLLGFLVGLYEASILWFIPRLPILLQPDVRYPIWFLAPLIGLVCFGLLGLGLGIAAAISKGSNAWRSRKLAAVGLGVVGAYIATAPGLAWSINLRSAVYRATPWIAFAVVFAGALLALRVWWRQAEDFFNGESPWLPGLLAKLLLPATAISLAGLAYYAVGRPNPVLPVEANSVHFTRGPNVILITLDAVRADHLPAYGYPRPTTPNLDKFVSQGVLFENAVSSSSYTIPSHISMFTGLLPHQHGASSFTSIDTGPWTLAEVLHSRGYETAGFTSNLGVGYIGWGMGQGFEVYEDDSSSLRHNLATTLVGRTLLQSLYAHLSHSDRFDRRNACEVNRDVLRWFQRRSDRPFFLFINYFDAHDPYWAPAPYDRRFGRISNAVLKRVSTLDQGRVPAPLSSVEQASLVAGYDNCVAFLDEHVGRLLHFLAGSAEWPNTIVIITSDHGKAFGEHGHYKHGTDLYRELLHVPLIIFGPGVPKGQRIGHIADLRQLFSTVLDLALDEGSAFRRSSLRRFWTPGFKPEPFDQGAVSELTVRQQDSSFRAYVSLTTAEWHYIQCSDGRTELYHWPTDLRERTNLVDSPQYQPTLQSLRARLEDYVGLSVRPWRGPDYLLALSGSGSALLREITFGRPGARSPSPLEPRVGSAQAYFAPTPSPAARPLPADEDLIRSLPYH